MLNQNRTCFSDTEPQPSGFKYFRTETELNWSKCLSAEAEPRRFNVLWSSSEHRLAFTGFMEYSRPTNKKETVPFPFALAWQLVSMSINGFWSTVMFPLSVGKLEYRKSYSFHSSNYKTLICGTSVSCAQALPRNWEPRHVLCETQKPRRITDKLPPWNQCWRINPYRFEMSRSLQIVQRNHCSDRLNKNIRLRSEPPLLCP